MTADSGIAPQLRRTRWLHLAGLSLGGLAWAVFVAFLAVRMQSIAASECERFWVGDRFGALFFTWPLLSLGMWTASTAALFLVGRRSLVTGLALGILGTLAIAYWFVAGTPDLIRSMPEATADICPSGVPAWWPAWLPQ
jgi:hypothetical protein